MTSDFVLLNTKNDSSKKFIYEDNTASLVKNNIDDVKETIKKLSGSNYNSGYLISKFGKVILSNEH